MDHLVVSTKYDKSDTIEDIEISSAFDPRTPETLSERHKAGRTSLSTHQRFHPGEAEIPT